MLGDTFIRNFYTTFDYKADIVSFAVSTNAPAGVTIERNFTGWVIFSIVFGCILGIVIIAYIARCVLRKYRKRKEGVSIGGTSDKGENYIYKQRLAPDDLEEETPNI